MIVTRGGFEPPNPGVVIRKGISKESNYASFKTQQFSQIKCIGAVTTSIEMRSID